MSLASDKTLLTVHLKHQKQMSLEEITAKLRATYFWTEFPPEGCEIVSWYLMAGIGHVITLCVPADQLREAQTTIEQFAWGIFETEFFQTSDFTPTWERLKVEDAERT